jgi:predicted dehydrogenase
MKRLANELSARSKPIYRAAIIGLGFVGAGDQVSGDAIGGQQVSALDGTHAEALQRNTRIKLVAGSSRDLGRRERFTQRTGIKAYSDWCEMLDAEKPEIVSIATYAPSHAEITCACAARGVRVIYCEKPIATRLGDAEKMISTCEKAGALLVINHNRRYNIAYRRLRDEISKGVLGELTSASLRWGSGRLGNVGTHLIDALCMLTRRSVEAVSGTLDSSAKTDCRGAEFSDPGGWGVMRLSGALMTTVDAANHGAGNTQISIYGRKARATVGREMISIEFSDGKLEQWPCLSKNESSMELAVAELIEWLDGKNTFTYPAADSVRILEAIMAFHVSHSRKSCWVELPLKGAERNYEVLSG